MQYILSVDATVDPAQAVIVKVDGRSVEVIESRPIDLMGELAPESAPANEAAQPSEPAVQEGSGQEDRPGLQNVPKAARTIATTRDQLGELPDEPSEGSPSMERRSGGLLSAGPVNLHEVLSTPWTNAVLIIPPEDYLSLNLELPFSDQRNIGKILDLEVQDVVPFDVSEFLLQHTSIAPLAPGSFDVHVSIIPKTYIRRLLKACRSFGFEPLIISTPSSIAAALYYIAPDYFVKNSAIIVAQDPLYYVTSCFEGRIRSERVIRRSQPVPGLAGGSGPRGGDSEENARQALLLELKMTVAATERRYRGQIECVYLVENTPLGWNPAALRQALGRNVQTVNLAELGREIQPATAMAGLGAVFAQDVDPPMILTNFRTREFSYLPPLKEVMAGLRLLLPLILSALMLLAVTMITVFYMRERHIGKLRSAMFEQIKAAMPDAEIDESTALQQLQRQNAALDEQLKDLGSPSSLSPLDVLLEISKDFPISSDTFLNQVGIRGNNVKLDGTAPDYAAVDRVEKALNKRKKSVYCRIKKDSGGLGAVAGSRSFSFEIWLCE